MSDPLALYKKFIDGLLQRLPSAEAARMRKKILYGIPSSEIQQRDQRRGYTESVATYERFKQYNAFLERLSDEDRAMTADLLQGEKEAGMAEVLALLADGQYRLVQDNTTLPFEPFDTPYYYDFTARVARDPWPDEKSE